MRRVDRRQQIQRWLETQLNAPLLALEPASVDASFRRYFRVRAAGLSLIAMDAPPEHEDCRPFVRVAGLLAAAGVHVPRVIAQELAHGFLLLSDLGTTGYLQALNDDSAAALFGDAIDALLRWQLASKPGVLPPYDAALLARELKLFPEWYLRRHLGVVGGPAQQQALDAVLALILESALAQPAVYVHRDYMPRNLMVCEPNPGVLDWTVRYWEKARHAGLPVAHDFGGFYRDFEWMGLQRHLKVLGIFARLHYRDGKRGYLEDTSRFIGYVRAVATRYQALRPLLTLLDEIEGKAQARAGHAF